MVILIDCFTTVERFPLRDAWQWQRFALEELGNLSKLTRRPRGGGHIQISIQLKSE